jgi:flavin-dependent dehydrogenase
VSAAEVVVIGAGFAGAACASMLAREGCRPLIVAPELTAPNRGETLSARAAPSLELLGWQDLLEPPLAIGGEERYSIWGGPRLVRTLPPEGEHGGWHVDRQRLERAVLARLASAGIGRITARAVGVSQWEGGVAVELLGGEALTAGFVADCTGRAALSAVAGQRRRLDRLTACHASMPLAEDAEAVAATLVEAVAGGWWYTSPGPDRRLTVSFFSDSDLMPSGIRRDSAMWVGLVGDAPATAERLRSLGVSLADARPQMASAASVVSAHLIDRRVIRAGDAVAALDPLASNGLATALWSGIQAARGIMGLAAGRETEASRYEAAFLDGILGQLRAQSGMYAAERRFRTHPFWTRRAP